MCIPTVHNQCHHLDNDNTDKNKFNLNIKYMIDNVVNV